MADFLLGCTQNTRKLTSSWRASCPVGAKVVARAVLAGFGLIIPDDIEAQTHDYDKAARGTWQINEKSAERPPISRRSLVRKNGGLSVRACQASRGQVPRPPQTFSHGSSSSSIRRIGLGDWSLISLGNLIARCAVPVTAKTSLTSMVAGTTPNIESRMTSAGALSASHRI